RTAGLRSPPRRLTAKNLRGIGPAGRAPGTPRAGGRGGDGVNTGTTPAQARGIISAQRVGLRGARNGWLVSERSSSGPSAAAALPAGTATHTGSESSSRRSKSGSRGRGGRAYSWARG